MSFGKDGKGIIINEKHTLSLGTLASGAALKATSLVMVEDFRMLRSEVIAIVEGLTAGEGGGLVFGLANGKLSDAEIAGCLVADGPLNKNDTTVANIVERFCKLIGVVDHIDIGATSLRFVDAIMDGPMMVTKPRWSFSAPESWAFFVYNQGASALTTGASVQLQARSFGVWAN